MGIRLHKGCVRTGAYERVEVARQPPEAEGVGVESFY